MAHPGSDPDRPTSPSEQVTREPSAAGVPAASSVSLVPGQAFGPRYRILKALGAGGMGAVYEAWDEEVGAAVALKVIRPDVLADPVAAREIERRFKRELVLARQVTHRHVIRIHDIGQIDGVRYLTMPFVDGEDLSTKVRREGRLPVPHVVSIAKQVAAGLAAAHEAGIVHRDLKPSNIMIDGQGTALIMDFGIATSVSSDVLGTRAGHIIGTLEYMAPEQAQGREVDQRADIYAFGLILYDLLTDRRRLKEHASPVAEMMARMTKSPLPVRTATPETTVPLAAIVDRCLHVDPASRYHTTAALLADLERLDEEGHVAAAAPAQWLIPRRVIGIAGLALVVAAVAVTASWFVFRGRPASAPVVPAPVSVLVGNFQNRSGDAELDGVLEPILGINLEGASFVALYSRSSALRALAQIKPGAPLDDTHAMLVAVREGVQRVVSGAIERQGVGYRIEARLVDPGDARVLFSEASTAASKQGIVDAVGDLSLRMRRAFGDALVTDDTRPGQETFTAASFEAAEAYARGQELQWAGKFEEALASYREAVRLDPTLGRAYAGMGSVSSNLGRQQEAETYYQQALQHLDRMTDREKYRTRGGYYLAVRNNDKAREEMEALIERFPADTAALANLAVAEFLRRDMARAVELGRQAIAAMPRNVIRLNNLALFQMYAGDFAGAERQARTVLELNPEFPKAHVALALSQLAEGRIPEAEETYRALAALPGAAAFYAASGLADLRLYTGRLAEAASTLEEALKGPAAGSASQRARLLVTLAEVRHLQGDRRTASTLASEASAGGKDAGIVFLSGLILARSGQGQAAAAAAEALRNRLEGEPQICACVLDGEIALAKGDARAAVEAFASAQKHADSWLGRVGLARAYLLAGAAAEADGEIDRCLSRRGEATAVLLDDVPTFRMVAPVYYYRGLVREAQKNPTAAAEAFKTFLAIKATGDEQGLVADARRRVEGR